MKENQSPKNYKGIMVSSTFSDMVEHRKILLEMLPQYGFFPIGMENDSAKDEDVIDSSLNMVRDSTVYVGIITHKYGKVYKDPRNPNELSLTELEFDEALKLGRPILLFIMGEDYDNLKRRDIELDTIKINKLEKFKEKAIKTSLNSDVTRIYDVFNNIDDFKKKVQLSLANVQKKFVDNSKETNSNPLLLPIKSVPENQENTLIKELKERIAFLEANFLGGFKLEKDYMGIIIPRIGDKYKLYVYKEFTLLQPNDFVKCRIHINNTKKTDIPLSLNIKNLNLSAYISYHSTDNNFKEFIKCEKENEMIDEISTGEEYFQFKIHFKKKQRDKILHLDINEGTTVAIFYTYDVYCAQYGNELVRKTSVFTDSKLVCELIYPKENEKHYNFGFYDRDEEKIIDDIETNTTDKSVLYTIQKENNFETLLNSLFKEENYGYCQIDYKEWLRSKNKSLQHRYAFVANWDFVPFFTDPDMYLKMERYVNGGSLSGFTSINNTNEKYTPYSKIPNFEVGGITIDNISNKCRDYGIPPKWLSENEILVHPEYKIFFTGNEQSTYTVIPTASSRTVYIPDKKCYAKLQYNKMIGRLERKFTPPKIDNAVIISSILKDKFDEKDKKDKSWNDLFFLPEIFGRIIDFGDNFREHFEERYLGMIIRDFVPYPKRNIMDSQRRLIPAFSLFAKNYENFVSKSILELLFDFRKDTKMNYEEFILNKIIKPVFKLYFELLLETGLHIEGHAQNILYLLSVSGSVLDINGVVIRDFESFDKDIDILNKQKLYSKFETLEKEKINSSSDMERYMKRNSFLFDFKLGEYLITPILEHSCEIKKDFDKNFVINEIKKFNANYIKKLPNNFYPQNKWYSYEKVLFDRSTTDRPWIENEKLNNGGEPKYR